MQQLRQSRRDCIHGHRDIVNAIRQLGGNAIRSRISEVTGVSIPTVSRALNDKPDSSDSLVQQGAAKEQDGVFRLCSDFAFYMGVHIGPSKMRFVLMNFNLETISSAQLNAWGITEALFGDDKVKLNRGDTPDSGASDGSIIYSYNGLPNQNLTQSFIADAVYKMTDKILRKLEGLPLLSIGFATPGITNYKDNTIIDCPNIPSLVNLSIEGILKRALRERLNEMGVIYCFEHDTEAVALYEKEHMFRDGSRNKSYANRQDIAFVYFGTGLGSAFILNGELFRGALGGCGEIGHLREPKPAEIMKKTFDSLQEIKFKHLDENGEEQEEDPLPLDHRTKYEQLECAIRKRVFNVPDGCSAYDYNKRTSPAALEKFPQLNPERYQVLVEYLTYATNVLVNVLNVGLIVLSGRILLNVPGLIDDIRDHKSEDALNVLANACEIISGEGGFEEVVALGTAIAAFYKSGQNDAADDHRPVKVIWQDCNG